MNITQEKTDSQLELLKIEINEADYKEKVQKSLKKAQKTIDMPGFRRGNVPFGLIEKMYGKSIKKEEIDNLIGERVGEYFSKNEDKILGSPLPNSERNIAIDWDQQTDFVIYYDLALVPEFNLDLEKVKATRYIVLPDDKLIDSSIQNIAKQYGKFDDHEEVSQNTMLFGEFVELDADGNPKEGGIITSSSFLVETLRNDKAKALFLGKHKEDVIEFDFKKVFENAVDTSSMLKISREQAENLDTKMRFTVQFCYGIKPHELDEELFEKIFPFKNIKTEENFRKEVSENLREAYAKETEKALVGSIQKEMIEKTKIELPKEFLIRWFAQRSEGKETVENIEAHWENSYEKSVKWQLIEKRISQMDKINVSKEELADFVKASIPDYLLNANITETEEEKETRINTLVDSVLKDEKNGAKFFETLFEKKIFAALIDKIKVTEKNVSYEDFAKEMEKDFPNK